MKYPSNMSHWNFRVLKHKHANGDWYAIHEVYYDKNKKPTLCSTEPDYAYGESIQELKECFKLMIGAFKKDILDYDSFGQEHACGLNRLMDDTCSICGKVLDNTRGK